VHNWTNHLCNALQHLSFTQSAADCCWFLYRDCLDFCSEIQENIDQLITELSKTYILQHEGDISAFLEVQVLAKDPSSEPIICTWPVLQIIKDIAFDEFSEGEYSPVDVILYANPKCLTVQPTKELTSDSYVYSD
jgi:hypothetical protein